MTLNQKHYRRIDLRKRFVFLSDAELVEYFDLDHDLVVAFAAGTVAHGRVSEFIPMDVE